MYSIVYFISIKDRLQLMERDLKTGGGRLQFINHFCLFDRKPELQSKPRLQPKQTL